MDFWLIEECDFCVTLTAVLDLRQQCRRKDVRLAMIPFCRIVLKFVTISSLFSVGNNINIISMFRCDLQ